MAPMRPDLWVELHAEGRRGANRGAWLRRSRSGGDVAEQVMSKAERLQNDALSKRGDPGDTGD